MRTQKYNKCKPTQTYRQRYKCKTQYNSHHINNTTY